MSVSHAPRATPGPARPDPGLVIEPPADRWRGLIRAERTDLQRTLRAQLGLPTDRPIIMSGHQAEFWGPGILAKWIACAEAAHAMGAHAAWLVADQDHGDASAIRYPAAGDDAAPRPGLARLEPGRPEGEGLKPTASQRPIRPARDVPGAVRPIADALRAHEGEPDAARQVQAALADLGAFLGPGPVSLFARELPGTTLFGELVGRMRDDPGACARAYNEAAARHPGSGVRALVVGDDARGPELPLWVITPGGERRRATARDTRETPVERLAPRALLLTALVRLGACDLFIHGTGGGAYDRVTEDWIGAWLRRPLAPAAVVTATVLPDVGAARLEDAERADRAAWLAHAARHNPSLLGDESADAAKRELVAQIARAKRAGEDPASLYRRLHLALRESRERHARALAALDEDAERLRGAAAGSRRGAQIARDRTLAFPLVPRDGLLALRDAIRERVRSGG